MTRDVQRRYRPEMIFPKEAYLPGKGGPHPEMAIDENEVRFIDINSPEENDFLCFALDLYHYEYYWESHVYLEALWKQYEKQSSAAYFLKALIQLGAAGLKIKLNQTSAAIDLLKRAESLLHTVQQNENEIFLGFDLGELTRKLKAINPDSPMVFSIYPCW